MSKGRFGFSYKETIVADFASIHDTALIGKIKTPDGRVIDTKTVAEVVDKYNDGTLGAEAAMPVIEASWEVAGASSILDLTDTQLLAIRQAAADQAGVDFTSVSIGS